ncbi:cell envelope integrity protein TolA [Methylomicrobium lacus]|uniref:cell envelope integrity protein TolA n=1 Tax=Methylomicrobium lacus TaxID=136992 RepID=UPI0035A82ED4
MSAIFNAARTVLCGASVLAIIGCTFGTPKQNNDHIRFLSNEQADAIKAIKAIRTKVNKSWTQPLNAPSGLTCKVHVKLLASGEVVEAYMMASSGDSVFDHSAIDAIRTASPLPVPDNEELFAKSFRSFTFTFDPDRGSY